MNTARRDEADELQLLRASESSTVAPKLRSKFLALFICTLPRLSSALIRKHDQWPENGDGPQLTLAEGGRQVHGRTQRGLALIGVPW